MASSEQPPTPTTDIQTPPATTGIQAPAEAPAGPSIPLAPLPQAPAASAEKFARLRGGLDAVLVVLVLALAFLMASSPAANSDFLRQLAAGRLLARGEYQFGVDPFTFASDGQYWVNHAWLFDLAAYGLYQIPAIGGVVVVVCKALLMALLAEILLRVGRRAGQSLWIPAVCTALAVLAVSPWLILRPVCLSFFFLGLTLWLLTVPDSDKRKSGTGSGTGVRRSLRARWLLPPLFALWVNCDSWFFVGPLAVALYLLGGLIQNWRPLAEKDPDDLRPRELGTLALVLIVGLAACLLNPHHIHAFTLPPEFGLSPAAELIQNDPQFHIFFLSPLQLSEYYVPNIGLSAAGLSYPLLLLAGAISFVLTFGRVPWWRLVVWVGFAALSLYHIRAIPFFAVAAGPIMALNWLDCAAQRLGRAPRLTMGWRRWSLGGRALSVLVGLVLLAAAVPGWLQARPYDSHRVGWGVKIDPSLEQAAARIKSWRDEGRLPAETHWFNLRSDMANYLAWFAPGERAFFDQRVTEFHGMARDYLAVRDRLEDVLRDESAAEQSGPAAPKKGRGDWQAVLRDRHVQYWIIDDTNVGRPEMLARSSLFASPDEWALCYLHGRIAIFAWKGGQPEGDPDPSAGLALDLRRLAFGPEAEQAPPQGPETTAPQREWWDELWDAWWVPKPSAAPDRGAAYLQGVRFLALQPRFLADNSRVWQRAVAVSAVGSALPHGPLPNSLLSLSWSCTYSDLFPGDVMWPRRPPRPAEREALKVHSLYVRGQDSGPVESLYLGIRAARRALLDNPRDAQTHLLLAQAYQRLVEGTRERFLDDGYPLLGEIRRTQMVAAYQNALRYGLTPREAVSAHVVLFNEFYRRKYLDLAVHHFRQSRENLRAAGPQPGQSAAEFSRQLEETQRLLTNLDDELKRQLDQYEVTAANRPLRDRVRIALERGLADKAREELSAADAGELFRRSQQGEETGMEKLVQLVLIMGRLDDARDLIAPAGAEKMATGGPIDPSLLLGFRLRLAAARGDYAEADQYLDEALHPAGTDASGKPTSPNAAAQLGVMVARVLFGEAQHATGGLMVPTLGQTPSEFWLRRWRLDALEAGMFAGQQHAEWLFLRAWLALEAGRCAEARRHYEAALNTVVPPERWMPEVSNLNLRLSPYEAGRLQELPSRQLMVWGWSREYLKWLGAAQH